MCKAIDAILRATVTDDLSSATAAEKLLIDYADLIDGWAREAARRMVMQAWSDDTNFWLKRGREISEGLRREIRNAPTGRIHQELMAVQVDLIKSLPLEAAQRVHKLATENVLTGRRPAEIIADIMKTGEVAYSRAKTIARTETARSAAVLMQARAVHVGSPGYFWRTVGDSDVRPDHQELDGNFYTWDNPPVADKRSGARAHPGCIFNCRCFSDPILPDIDRNWRQEVATPNKA